MKDRIEELHQLADLYRKLTNSVLGTFNTDVSLEDTVNTKALKGLIELQLESLYKNYISSTKERFETV